MESSAAPPLLPIFRSRTQARVLTILFLDADRKLSLVELARATHSPVATIHREVKRLDEAGLLISERVGNIRLMGANRDLPYFQELQSLLLKTFGPASVLAEALGPIKGVDEAYLFGSWARRFAGEPGLSPGDIDVVVIGDPDPDDVYEACRTAESQLGNAINPSILSRQEWDDTDRGFIKTVRGQLVPVMVC